MQLHFLEHFSSKFIKFRGSRGVPMVWLCRQWWRKCSRAWLAPIEANPTETHPQASPSTPKLFLKYESVHCAGLVHICLLIKIRHSAYPYNTYPARALQPHLEFQRWPPRCFATPDSWQMTVIYSCQSWAIPGHGSVVPSVLATGSCRRGDYCFQVSSEHWIIAGFNVQ